MGKIYAGQSDLTIKLETSKNLTGISDVKIIAKSPTGVLKEFMAEVTNAISGSIKYDVQSVNDINVAGKWTFWARTVTTGGLISIGEPSTILVYKQGT